MQGVHPEPKQCAGETGLLESPCAELLTDLEMSYWLGNGLCLELWSNFVLISKQDLNKQVSI